jgi:hypothetical protein
MGVHSLGGARPENSGYRGKWTGPGNAGLSEIYYTNMVSSGIKWTNVVSINVFSSSKIKVHLGPLIKMFLQL